MSRMSVVEAPTDSLPAGGSSSEPAPPAIEARPFDCERLFLDHLSAIKAIVAFIGRRRRLSPHELEEFAAHVNLKLIEDDYAVLRKFQGRSSLRSYLAVVIQRLFLDWRVAQWGKWRPSAFARQHGKVALLLEQLTACQGMTFEEARMTMETAHQGTVERSVLEAIYAGLPARSRRRFAGDEALEDVAAEYGDPMTGLVSHEEASVATHASRVLSDALAALAPNDLRLLKLRFADGLTVAAIAKSTSEDAKRLYRRIRRLLEELRDRLQQRGVDQHEVLAMLGRTDLQLTGVWASRK